MKNEKKGIVARLDDTAFARKYGEIWKFIKFSGVSIVCAAIELVSQLLALPFFKSLGVEKLPGFIVFRWLEETAEMREGYTLAMVVYAFMASTAIGYMIGFFVNRKTTFHADSNVALGIVLNVLLIVFVITANSVIGPVIEGFLPRLGFISEGFIPTLAKVLSMAATGIWVYPANRFIIHRTKKGTAPNEQ